MEEWVREWICDTRALCCEYDEIRVRLARGVRVEKEEGEGRGWAVTCLGTEAAGLKADEGGQIPRHSETSTLQTATN